MTIVYHFERVITSRLSRRAESAVGLKAVVRPDNFNEGIMITGFGSGEKETAVKIIKECAEAMKLGGEQGIKDVQAKYAKNNKTL